MAEALMYSDMMHLHNKLMYQINLWFVLDGAPKRPEITYEL